jgi:zinc protease
MSRFLAFGFFFLAAVSAMAQGPEKVASVEGVTEYLLSNGSRVVMFPEPSRPTVTVNMTVLVGSRHEGYGEAGMAHLLEHMVFKGTPTFADVPKALRDHGASFNGTTNQDRTNYFETLAATDENLEFAIHLESDRLVNSYVRHSDLISEFSVVRNEFERGENSPQAVLSQRVMAAAFEWHNYGKTTIGNRSDIERVPIHNLQNFYRKYYQPDNVVMIITGKFEEEKALALVQKYLGKIPRPERKLDPTYTEEPPQDGERNVILRRVGKIGSISVAYHMPAASHEDWAPLSTLASILSEDKVGLLEKKLVETKLATNASARSDSSHDPGLFFFSAQPEEGKLDEVRNVLLSTLDQLGEQTYTAEAVERAKLRSQRQMENLLSDAQSMSQALSSATSLGDWRLLFLQRDRMKAVTAEDVSRVAKKYFQPFNRTVGMFIPSDTAMRMEIPAVASINDLVKEYKGGSALRSGEEFDTSPANLADRTRTLDINGIKVSLLQKQNRGETVSMAVTFHYGNEDSLADKNVAAGMVPGMLMAGTKNMNRQALQEKMESLGIRISTGGGGGGRGGGRRGGGGGGGGTAGQISFSIEAKKSSIGEAIKLVDEILHEPAFPEDEFDQTKSRMIAGMTMMQTEPQMLAANQMSRALSKYEKGDVRYVPTTEESIENLKNLKLDDLKEIYSKQLSAAHGEVAIVGEFDMQPTLAAVNDLLKEWNSDVEYRAIKREAKKDLVGSKSEINTPDKENAVFTAGLAFEMNEADEDSAALVLGNFILGGGTLSSRLGDRIRQKEGLSYGVTSTMTIPDQGTDARFMITATMNPGNIDAVEKAANEELARFLADGPTDAEVADAQKGWLESQKVSRARDGSIAGQLNSNAYLGRTFDYTIAREKKISSLTAAEIKNAFQKHIDPKKLIVIRAGDLKKKSK